MTMDTEELEIMQNWVYKCKPILSTDGINSPTINLKQVYGFSESGVIFAKFDGKEMKLFNKGVADVLALKYCRRFGV